MRRFLWFLVYTLCSSAETSLQMVGTETGSNAGGRRLFSRRAILVRSLTCFKADSEREMRADLVFERFSGEEVSRERASWRMVISGSLRSCAKIEMLCNSSTLLILYIIYGGGAGVKMGLAIEFNGV